LQSLQTKKDAENLSHMVPIRSILAAKYGISHLTKLISLVFQQAEFKYGGIRRALQKQRFAHPLERERCEQGDIRPVLRGTEPYARSPFRDRE
jgi:hypothetical protein